MAVDQIATKGLLGQLLNDDPANGAVAVTKSDTLDVFGKTSTVNSQCSRRLWVGGVGDVKVTLSDGTVVTYSAVPAGTYLRCRARQLWSTGTTATLVIAEY